MKTSSSFNNLLEAFIDPNIRVIVMSGGTSSSKTWSIIQLLGIIYPIRNGSLELISVVSESIPHLKRGVISDYQKMMGLESLWSENSYNRTDRIYTHHSKRLEFFPADSPAKLRGGRRDILYINEANNISYESYSELEIRTAKKIIVDFNPTAEFWVHEHLLTKDESEYGYTGEGNVKLINSTYRDNEFLEESIINSIESRRETNPNWYKVYGLGLLGSLEGTVYTNWTTVDKMPEKLEKESLSLDWGYSNDPLALLRIGIYEDEVYIDELMYETKLSNRMFAERVMKSEYSALTIIADSAEPKSIDEVKSYGLRIRPAVKGRDSILHGIQILQDYKINVTKRSLGTIKELRNYTWLQDALTGKYYNKPIDMYNHSLDSLRYYALVMLKRTGNVSWKHGKI